MQDSLGALRYPIGRFEPPVRITAEQVSDWISEIEGLPGALRRRVNPLTAQQLATPYRPGGWTVQQVVHHLADSHLNSFIRFKWALTEDRPTIKDYREDRWAELADYRETSIATSLELLAALHARWCVLLRSLGTGDLRREFVHPESGPVALDVNIGTYAWHGRHHLAHIEKLVELERW